MTKQWVHGTKFLDNKRNGEYQNECEEYDGHTCTLGTSTTLSDVTGYTAAVTSLLQAIPGLTTITSIVDWVISLFN